MQARTRVKQIALSVVQVKCKCGKPESHPEQHCPVGEVIDHGTLAYHSAYWHQRLLFRLKRWLNPKAAHWHK